MTKNYPTIVGDHFGDYVHRGYGITRCEQADHNGYGWRVTPPTYLGGGITLYGDYARSLSAAKRIIDALE